MLYNVVYIVRSHFKIILVPGVLTADTGLSLPASGEHWTLASSSWCKHFNRGLGHHVI